MVITAGFHPVDLGSNPSREKFLYAYFPLSMCQMSDHMIRCAYGVGSRGSKASAARDGGKVSLASRPVVKRDVRVFLCGRLYVCSLHLYVVFIS